MGHLVYLGMFAPTKMETPMSSGAWITLDKSQVTWDSKNQKLAVGKPCCECMNCLQAESDIGDMYVRSLCISKGHLHRSIEKKSIYHTSHKKIHASTMQVPRRWFSTNSISGTRRVFWQTEKLLLLCRIQYQFLTEIFIPKILWFSCCPCRWYHGVYGRTSRRANEFTRIEWFPIPEV